MGGRGVIHPCPGRPAALVQRREDRGEYEVEDLPGLIGDRVERGREDGYACQ